MNAHRPSGRCRLEQRAKVVLRRRKARPIGVAFVHIVMLGRDATIRVRRRLEVVEVGSVYAIPASEQQSEIVVGRKYGRLEL